MYNSKFISNSILRTGLAMGLACALFFAGCKKNAESVDDTYVFKKPSNFPEPNYTFNINPVTKNGFLLGRKLFYDPILSRDNSVSCNSCHIQSLAFADAQQHPVSVGIDGQFGKRNAPPLTNLAFYKEFFWDGGVTHLDFVPINAITAPFEMDEKLDNVVRKLNSSKDYKAMFKSAFNADTASSPLMLQALSQFLTMMVSANSRYDKYVRHEGEQLTSDELAGLSIFKDKCSQCHAGELFTDLSYRNNGISSSFPDIGRAKISEYPGDTGKFQVPSLRNVARTSPYMHNAKFQTLQQVLDHYDSGVIPSATLDPLLKQNGTLGIPLTADEKNKIIAFLQTLTDMDFVADTRFSNQ